VTDVTPIIDRDRLRRFMAREGRVWGAGVRSRRRSLGLTLEQLAGLADTTPQTIHKIERGTIVPRDDLRIALALALADEVDALFPMPDRKTVMREAS
jgi:transcriptional regulator with XRE-family HTH domain